MDVKLRYMKSSRQRFREFRSKVRSGLLRGDRLQEPAPPTPNLRPRRCVGTAHLPARRHHTILNSPNGICWASTA